MRIEKHDNKHGSSGCYMCKKKKALYDCHMPLLLEYDTGADVIVCLCADCAKLDETQLRTYFLG